MKHLLQTIFLESINMLVHMERNIRWAVKQMQFILFLFFFSSFTFMFFLFQKNIILTIFRNINKQWHLNYTVEAHCSIEFLCTHCVCNHYMLNCCFAQIFWPHFQMKRNSNNDFDWFSFRGLATGETWSTRTYVIDVFFFRW